MKNLYDRDFYLWTKRTVQTLIQHDFDKLDLDSLIEEIETLGRSEKNEIQSRFEVLLHHLLKWKYQPDKRTNSW